MHTKFSNCSVRIVYQATLQNKCSKYPPSDSMYASTCLIKDCRTLLKVPGRLLMVLRQQNFVGEATLHFQVEVNFFYDAKTPSGPGPPHC